MTHAPLLFLPDGIELHHISIKDEELRVSLIASAVDSQCPSCSQCATRVHSRYSRTVADVPCGGRRVLFSLLVRKFFCQTPDCPRKIFTERFPNFLRPWARMTDRLR